jgi:adenosine deaminase
MSQLAATPVPIRLDVQGLPKISLHDHLDGAVRLETLLELAPTVGLELPAGTGEALRSWMDAASRTGSLVDYLRSFDLTVAVMQSADHLARIAQEYVEDLVADNVVYGEVRWAPELFVDGGLSMDDAVVAVQAGIDAATSVARVDGRPVEVRQILSAMRNRDRSVEVARLALRHRDAGVVGFDIAGPEKGYLPARCRAAFDLLHQELMPVTVHAGEADGLTSIASALHDGRALRLGHGVRIAEDITRPTQGADEPDSPPVLGRLASWVRDRRIPLETSPTSNLHTGVFAAWGDAMTDHPFDLLYRSGFAVTVNTDNRLMSDTTMTNDFAALRDAFGYVAADFESFTLNAARAAFLPLPERDRLAALVRTSYAQLAEEAVPAHGA